MPTDGADFGRMKACYGKAYTAARLGAEDGEVAEIVSLGEERDIRRDGGSPAFSPAVDLIVIVSESTAESRCHQLLAGVDGLRRDFADSSLTRYFAAAAETIGLTVVNEGRGLSRMDAAVMLLIHFWRSRCGDGMTSYLTKNRTQSVAQSLAIVGSITSNLARTNALRCLAARMLNASPSGLPAKTPKQPPIEHSAYALNNISLEGGL